MPNRFHPLAIRIGVGGLVLIAVTFIGYYPSIKVGFLGDDWWFLGKAASLNLPEYLAFYFDPRVQIFWYRPLYGILLGLEYLGFGAVPDGYHWGQIALHAINCLLLFAVVYFLSRRWRAAFLAALFYALMPVNNLAIFWIAVQDPLAMIFYLAAIGFWVAYLKQPRALFYGLAYFSFILALLGKEASVFLPVTLLLVDWLLIQPHSSMAQTVRRYAPWGIGLLIYLLIEYRVQTSAYFPNRWGYGVGWHIVENMAHYFALLAFPWNDTGIIYLVSLIFGVGALIVGIKTHPRLTMFVLLQMLLTIAPALAFPTQFFQARYLYFAAAIAALIFALMLEWLYHRLAARAVGWVLAALLALLFVGASANVTMVSAAEQAEAGRQMRVPLRDIYQQHPAYRAGTYLYFVEPPYPMIMRNLTGMFRLRYGANVTVWSNDAEWGGVDEDRFANLRDYPSAFVYYFDSAGQRHEIPVARDSQTSITPPLPAQFQSNIQLIGYEVTSARIPPGGEQALLLYWKASAPIDQDYMVFVHLVDARGNVVWGADAPPRDGHLPTTKWRPDKLVADVHLLQIPSDAPRGTYRLQIGLYDLTTLARLTLLDAAGQPIGDTITIAPFEITD